MHASRSTGDPVMPDTQTSIQFLGRLLGDVIGEQQGPEAFALVEDIRRHSVDVHRSGVAQDSALDTRLGAMAQTDLVLLIRAFAIFSQLANIGEDETLRRQTAAAGPRPWPTLDAAFNTQKARALLDGALLAPVITAHPTEVRRKSIIDREIAIAHLLEQRESADSAARAEIEAQIKREIRTLWQTRMLRPQRIHVTDEIENSLAVFNRTFLTQIPVVKRRLASFLQLQGPLSAFLRLGSWVGGDRDGNPNVSPQTLDYALRRQAEILLGHYLAEIHALGGELSLSDELSRTSDALKALAATPDHISSQQTDEPYRRALVTCYARMAASYRTLLNKPPARPPRFTAAPYATPEAFSADLDIIAASLQGNANPDLADGRLLDLREAVGAFGFHLAAMDLRQNSEVHEKAVAELLASAGVAADYLALAEADRVALLVRELSQPRLLRSPFTTYQPETQRELDIADHAATLRRQFGAGAVANYVISKTASVSDLLETAILMKEAGLFIPGEHPRVGLRIVPLFETVDDLRRSAAIMADYFGLPMVRAMIAGQEDLQEIMIGYSDSNKDGGYVTSNWEIRGGIARLVALGKDIGIKLRFFHGRGGAVGRGGGSSFAAIRALPEGASAHGLRVTEQGEVVASKYGDPEIGRASLETIVVANLLAELRHEPDGADSRDAERGGAEPLAALSAAAYKAYRDLVYETPDFPIFFRQSTPLPEISDLKIGSRPASRTTSGRIEDLRAIPWVFSWSQARVMLPGWYGFGSAANEIGLDRLKPLYQSSAFFRSTIANMEMVLAKSSLTIARHYAELVEDKVLAARIFGRIESEWHATRDAVLAISGQTLLLERDARLASSIRHRLPYVDALNYLQVGLLRRRRAGDDSEEIHRGIHMSINGVSAGLRNTG